MSSIEENLYEIINLARLAPSVHNTQPWKVQALGDQIKVAMFSQYVVKEGDPTGRQTIISMGIFCEAVRLCAEAYGFTCLKLTLHDNAATMQFKAKRPIGFKKNGNIDLLKSRCSDRSIYKPAKIEAQVRSKLKDIKIEGVRVEIITDRALMLKIAELTSKGIKLALSNPAFRHELSRYLLVPLSRKKRGISVKSIYIPWPLAVLEPMLIRLGWSTGAEATLERRRWESSSAVISIFADGDAPNFWLNAGRAYFKASLVIEGLGFSQATSAAIVEASNYHDDIEEALHTSQRILALIRIGKGKKKRFHSPRVLADELITSN
jgi:hypothetical protein